MFSKIDFRLILELQKDGTISYSDLAERMGITSRTAAKRIEGLVESKLIEIRALPNPFKLGLAANALIAVKADPSKIDSICDNLIDSFYVNLVQPVFGRFDIILIVYFPGWEMLHDFLNHKLSRIEGVTKVETYFIKEIVKRYEGLFRKEAYQKAPKIKGSDWTLIRALVKNGRASTSELAQELGTHVTTVYRRIAMLTREDYIKIKAVPNPGKLGYASNAHIVLEVDPAKVHAVCETLFPYPEIHLIMTVIDGTGIIIGVHKENNETLYRFIKEKIAPIRGIRFTETFIRTEIRKRYYGWFLEEPGTSPALEGSGETASGVN